MSIFAVIDYIWLATCQSKMSKKGRGKIGQNALRVTLFKQVPREQIGPKFKYFCVHHKANDQTIILSPDNVQKVQSRP